MLLRSLAIACVAGLLGTASCHATAFYVSASGSESACTVTQPCQFLSVAMTAAGVGDTIICLTPPQPSNLSVTKSITIDCPGLRAQLRDNRVYAGVAPPAVFINIPTSSSDPLRVVRLRGLTIDGENVSQQTGRWLDEGIEIDAASAVYVEDCVIANVKSQGIYDRRSGGQTLLFVKNTVISGNGGPGIVALSGATAITVLDNVSLLNNSYGVAAATGNYVTITRSVISGNTTAGVEADSGAQVNVSNSVISNNNVGVQYGGGTLRLYENDIGFNNTALQGATVSMGANRFSGNGTLGTTPALASGASGDAYN